MLNYFPIGVLARTEQDSKIPFLDDLSHHMLVVAAANLATGSPEAVLASLMHDMFKGLMIWNVDAHKIRWMHFYPRTGVYENLISFGIKINAKQVASFIQTHHNSQDTTNPIRRVESSQGLVTSLESKLILDQVPTKTKALVIKLSGRYRWLLAFYIHLELKRRLTNLYSDRLNSILKVRNIVYHYIPANLSRRYSNINDCLQSLDLEALQAYQDEDSLHINLPVLNLPRPMTIAYGKYDSLEQNEDSLQVPFGDALSLMALDGAASSKAKLLYVDAGFTVTLEDVVKCLKNELKNRTLTTYSDADVARSLEGTFKGTDRCSFCGESASVRLPLRDTSRFTSIQVLLDSRLCVCPTCAVGYELEEQLRARQVGFKMPTPALVDKVELSQLFTELGSFIKGDNYLMSLSGELWLQILSEVWYQEYQRKTDSDADYLLNPRALMLPVEEEFIPQAIYPLMHARQKKFALESGLSSSLVLPGAVRDIDVDEFRAIKQSYRSLGVKAEVLLKRIKQIYDLY
ncbi:MAG: hypothetical protein QXG63_06560 [Nitrososphaerales archaeon]